MSIQRLLQDMVASSGERSGAVLEMATRFALRDKDMESLVLLAKRSDLPESALALVAGCRDASVRIAYLQRPELSLRDIQNALAQEKRVTVLATVLASPVTTDALAETIWNTMSPPRPLLCSALLESGRYSPELRMQAFEVMWSHPQSYPSLLVGLLGENPDLHQKTALALGSSLALGVMPAWDGSIMRLLLRSPHVDSTGLVHLYNQVLGPSLRSEPDALPVHGYVLEGHVESLVERAEFLPRTLRDNLRQDLIRIGAAGFSQSLLSRSLQILQEGAVSQDLVSHQKEQAQESADPVVLREISEAVLAWDTTTSSGQGEQELLRCTLLRNENLPQDLLLVLVGSMRPETNYPLLCALAVREDLSLETCVGLARANVRLLPYLCARTNVPREELSLALAEVLHWKDDTDYQWNTLIKVQEDSLSEELVRLLPWSLFREGGVVSVTDHKVLGEVLNDLLTKELGREINRWEMFQAVAATHSGTLGELLETVRLLEETQAE